MESKHSETDVKSSTAASDLVAFSSKWSEAALPFGLKRRELPSSVEMLIYACLHLSDVASLFFVSRGFSARMIRFLQGAKRLELSAELFDDRTPDKTLPKLALACRSLTHVCVVDNSQFRVYPDVEFTTPWAEQMIANNQGSLRVFEARLFLWTRQLTEALLRCKLLESADLDVDENGERLPHTVWSLLDASTLPHLRRLKVTAKMGEDQGEGAVSQSDLGKLLKLGLPLFRSFGCVSLYMCLSRPSSRAPGHTRH